MRRLKLTRAVSFRGARSETTGAPFNIRDSGIHATVSADTVSGPVVEPEAFEELHVLSGHAIEEHFVRQLTPSAIQPDAGLPHRVAKDAFGFGRIASNSLERVHAKKPRMTTAVPKCSREPVFVISEQAYHLCIGCVSKTQNRIDATPRIRTSVDVIAKEHDGVI